MLNGNKKNERLQKLYFGKNIYYVIEKNNPKWGNPSTEGVYSGSMTRILRSSTMLSLKEWGLK